MSREILVDLDPDQRAAVTARNEWPLLVAAGPGAGKTRVLTRRIAWLIQATGIPAGHVMALTFTNAAAKEMGERLYDLIGSQAMRCRLSTIHALAARIVRAHAEKVGLTHDFTIFDQDAQLKLAAQVLEREESGIEPADLVRQVSLEKSMLKEPAQLVIENRSQLARAWEQFDEAQTRANGLDFEGLIVKAIELLGHDNIRRGWQNGIRAVLVDEFQDVSEAQFELLRMLIGETGAGLSVIGDEDQSLYSWRGASTALMTGFERHFPECQVINLARNYRSHEAIVGPARRLIEHNNGRRGKELVAHRDHGSAPRYLRVDSEEAEALAIVAWAKDLLRAGESPSEMAVLLRVRSLPLKNELERSLAGAGIAYHAVGSTTLWERSEVRDVLALFHLLANERHMPAFARVFEQIKGIGTKATDAVVQAARKEDKTPLEICREGSVGLGPKRDAAVQAFLERYDHLIALDPDRLGFSGWVGQVISGWGFPDTWKAEKDGRKKRESVVQLYRAADEFEARCAMESTDPTISDWLNELSLHAPQSGKEAERQGLALATIHASKGLEFSHVWLAGFDEGVLPSARSLEEGREDEERRLAYVAITRAKETLTVSSSEYRRGQDSQVSRFATEAGLV
ncbi:MAG: ATP-dependent helicase [Solirubrobacterales bacterium]|nr:ATP-dependent helicase [Solirubrobacterales bacterium]